MLALLVIATSAAAQQPTTTRVSLGSTGAEAEGASEEPTVSADGRWVAFSSWAPNLVADDTNGSEDVFVRDRQTGQTRRINLTPDGSQVTSSVRAPEITPDGRFVVFRSNATELVPGSSGFRLFLWDRTSGQIRLVPTAGASYGAPDDPSISADGTRIAFSAFDVNDFNRDVFVADMATGTVQRVSETPAGARADPPGSFDPDISGDGRWVGFTTAATNLVTPDTNGYRDVVVRDLVTGAFTRVSVGAGGAEANLHSSTPALSFDGCFVAFYSDARNLVANDQTGPTNKVYVRDRCGADTEIASVSNLGVKGTSSPPVDLSDDGCRVVFLSASAVASPPPSSGSAAVLRNRCAGTTSRLDVATTGDPGTGDVTDVSIAGGTGRFAVFATPAANLVSGDTKGHADVFLRDPGPNTPPIPALSLSQDGRRVTATATASRDPDGFVLNGSISFGDGSPAQAGLQATHEYSRGGVYSVSVTVTDADGVARTAAAPVTVPDPGAVPPPAAAPPPTGAAVTVPSARPPGSDPGPLPLVLDRVALSRSRFAVVPAGARPGGTRGAQLTLRLSAPATVTLLFERARRGRRVRGRCVVGARRGSRCTRYSSAGTLTRTLRAGTSTIVLTGRFGSRSLGLGAHRLSVRALSASGEAAAPRTLTFTIVRASRRRR